VAGQRAAQSLRSSIRIDPAYMVLPQYESGASGAAQSLRSSIRIDPAFMEPGSPRGGRRQTRIEQPGERRQTRIEQSDSGDYSSHGDHRHSASRASASKSPVSIFSRLGSIFTKEKPVADESTRRLRGACVIDVPCDLQQSIRKLWYCFV
jgi:hypothetical protein